MRLNKYQTSSLRFAAFEGNRTQIESPCLTLFQKTFEFNLRGEFLKEIVGKLLNFL